MRFFFYGTLIDEDVRALVLDGLDLPGEFVPARLDGWRCAGVRGKTYPAAVPRAGAVTRGLLTGEASDAVFERLVAYEGAEYDCAVCAVVPESPDRAGRAASAHVFVAGPFCRTTPLNWDFENWRRTHKRRFVARLRSGRLV